MQNTEASPQVRGRTFVKRDGQLYLVSATRGAAEAAIEYRIDSRVVGGDLSYDYFKVAGTIKLQPSERLEIDADIDEELEEDRKAAERDYRREFAGVDGDGEES